MRAYKITKELKKHKSDLFCKLGDDQKLHIYQERFPEDIYVCSLTDNWNKNGEPCDWGILPIINKLKAHDMASDGGVEFWNMIVKDYEKNAESKRRDFDNSVESFLYEFRPQFARATNDVNTACLAKLDKRRIRDGSIKS